MNLIMLSRVSTTTSQHPITHYKDQVKTPKMELDENDMLVEPEQYNKMEEELVSAEDNMWGLDRIRSSDGHTFRVEHDVNKQCVNILFDEEVEVPINKEADRRVTKAAKRAQQRLLMKEELVEFKMSQCKQNTIFQSTETSISKGEEEPVSRKAAKRTTSTPEPSAKPGDSKDDEDPTAETDIARIDPAERGKLAGCQDEIEVVTESTSARQEENETQGSKKIKIPLKAKTGVMDISEDFVTLKPDSTGAGIVDNHAKDAEENEERPNCPNHPRPEIDQVLHPAAPEVSNT